MPPDITEIRVGDIVTWAGQQWRVIRWTHDGLGVYSCDLEPIEPAAPDLDG